MDLGLYLLYFTVASALALLAIGVVAALITP